MKLSRGVNLALFLTLVSGAKAQAKSSEAQFDLGYKNYMAADCADAMEPFYQSSLREPDTKDRALLYLAHCQSIFGRSLDAAYNLDQIKSKNLKKDEQKLYKELMTKHRGDIDTMNKLYFNATLYGGQGSSSPSTVKSDASFYGLSLGVSRPTWSVGAFYENYDQKIVSSTAYTQSMVGGNLGYFVLPSWRISGSYTNIHGSTDQLNSVSVIGAQTDYYFTPTWSLFLEYYSSSYPKLLANKAGTYKYPVNASQFVAGLGFPIYNSEGFGINGAASYSGITLDKSKDTAVVAETNLANDTSRFEVVLSTYISKATAALTYWSGKEVLGVRSRGAIVMDSTDLHKDGEKLSLGYAINKYLSLGASYGMETYTAEDTTAKYRDFQSSTMTGLVSINW